MTCQRQPSCACGGEGPHWTVLEVWESQEAAWRLFDEQLCDTLQQAGVGSRLFFQVHNIIKP